MKEWKKTIITWGREYHTDWETNIPVDDLPGCGPHTISSMTAVSIQEGGRRQAILMFNVIRGVIGPTTKRQEIVELLKTIPTPTGHIWVLTSHNSSNFKIVFDLKRQFCEEVLDFMRHFFRILGIDDSNQFMLSDFSIKQETLIKQGDGWIPFEVHFKIQNQIRVDDLEIEQMPSVEHV